MGDNSHGTNNELEMAQYLDGKKIKELNLTMKEFIKYICNSKGLTYHEDGEIKAEYVKNNKLKQDIYIWVDGQKFGISLKMGVGNSCHQELIEDFVNFISSELGANSEICDLWRLFIWADGTLDGTGDLTKGPDGKILSRFGCAVFKKRYPAERVILQNFLDDNRRALINRFLFVGKYNSIVDFVYHGTYRQGRWISKEQVLDFQDSLPTGLGRACLRLGSLSVQAWNVSKEGNTEHKRGQVQLKYDKMKEDFEAIMRDNADTIGTFMGDLQEFDLSNLLNRDKKNPMWNTLLPGVSDFSNYYVVKVSSNQMSRLSEKKVKTKSDAYVVKIVLDRAFLLSKEYILDEGDIRGKEYEVQNETGISIKMKDSKNFTYQKLTRNSFCKAFANIDDVEFWMVSLLIYSVEQERYKNVRIINDFGMELEEYLSKVSTIMGINTDDTDNGVFWDTVRKTAQVRIKEEVLNDTTLSENIFMGLHWFDAPYHANFLYEKGELKKNEVSDFSITTGSGRSSGKYNIEFTPCK